MMPKQLRLHRQTLQRRPVVAPITHAPQHHIARPRHVPHPQLIQHPPRARPRHAVRQGARVAAGAMHDARVRRILRQQLPAAVLRLEVLLLGDGGVVRDNSAAEEGGGVGGLGEAGAAVAQPEDVPAGDVAVGGGGGGRDEGGAGVGGDVEVGGALAGEDGEGVAGVEEGGGLAVEGLEEELRGLREGVHLGFEPDVPVDVVFEDEGGGEVLFDDPGGG